MPEVLDWQVAGSHCQIVRRTVEALSAGQLVALPTETVYGIAASALVPSAVERLAMTKGRADDKPLALAIGGLQEALDWVPGMSALARRLARRSWPGPVTLVCKDGIEDGLASRLSSGVRQRVCGSGAIGLRVPAHEAVLQVLRRLPGPLVLTSANRSGATDAITTFEVMDALGECLDLVVADSPCRYGKPSTVVQVDGASWKILREGVVPASTLERRVGCIIVFICTGNTCRSPLAEGLFKKLLAERLNCSVNELSRKGFIVLSAGLAAMMGARAAPEAIGVGEELGADLNNHLSRPLTADLAGQADFLFAMTRSHLHSLAQLYPGIEGSEARLLSGDGDDIPDPIGCEPQVYRDCAHQILSYLPELVEEVQQP